LTAPLYEKREKLVSQIPNFWPLVIEQAPPDIDQFIQPSDSALLLFALKSLSVSHFEANSPDTGNPRSIAIKFEFTENDHFTNTVLEKKFWYRRARDGWTGLVSEPVRINWKEGEGNDLTGGLLDAVCNAWDSANKANGEAAKGLNDKQKALAEKISGTGMGGLSFFAWFGFVGRKISEAESREASEAEKKRKKGEDVEGLTEEEEEQEDLEMSLEIFPDGDDLAVAFAEDVWPGAIKYFSESFCFSSFLAHSYFPVLDPSRQASALQDNTNLYQPKHKNKTLSQTSTLSPSQRAWTLMTMRKKKTTRRIRHLQRSRRNRACFDV
jgi:hypothetical protein